MKGHYCLTKNRRNVFIIPRVLAGIESKGIINYNYNPKFLKKLGEGFLEGKISRELAEEKGWKVREFDIPDIYVQGFIYACQNEDKDKIERCAEEIHIHVAEEILRSSLDFLKQGD